MTYKYIAQSASLTSGLKKVLLHMTFEWHLWFFSIYATFSRCCI